MKTAAYIEALRGVAPRPSVYAVAQVLDLPEETVRGWVNQGKRPDTWACCRIAEVLGIDPFWVIADVEAEREPNNGKKKAWRALARRVKRLRSTGERVSTAEHAAGVEATRSYRTRAQVRQLTGR